MSDAKKMHQQILVDGMRSRGRRSKASGWQCRSFCRTREALLRCIRECCGSVDESASKQVGRLSLHGTSINPSHQLSRASEKNMG
jgi:hypothetical protein